MIAGSILDTFISNFNIDFSRLSHSHADFSFISYISSFVLILFGIRPVINSIRMRYTRGVYCFVFSVPDISCNSCAERIKSKINAVEGITAIGVDVKRKKLKVCSNLDNRKELKDILASIGYPVVDEL